MNHGPLYHDRCFIAPTFQIRADDLHIINDRPQTVNLFIALLINSLLGCSSVT